MGKYIQSSLKMILAPEKCHTYNNKQLILYPLTSPFCIVKNSLIFSSGKTEYFNCYV